MIWPKANLRLPAPRDHQSNPADQANAAHDRREIDPVLFRVLDLNRTQLGVLFLTIPTEPTVGKADDADDDQDDADNARKLHRARACGVR
jgi:hypothetical protein